MKKTLYCLAVMTAALVACQKNEMPASEEVQGIPMTLKASLSGDIGTKANVAPDGSGLKTTWAGGESISVVTLNGTGDDATLKSVDTFSYVGAAGLTDVEFKGTFTGGPNPDKVIVIYPALQKQSDDSYQTPKYLGNDGNFYSILAGIKVGDKWFSDCTSVDLAQNKDNNCDHFYNYCVMTGDVNLTDIKSDKLTVSLRNLMTVFKIVITVPDELKGKVLSKVAIQSNDSGGSEKWLFGEGGWNYVNLDVAGLHFTGAKRSAYWIYGKFVVPESGIATIYAPVVILKNENKNIIGDKWEFEITFGGGENKHRTKTFTKNVTYQEGMMYTVNVEI